MIPVEQRLCRGKDFRRVYSRGRSHATDLAVAHVLRRPEDRSSAHRFGFVVNKKQGKAAIRNRIKRRLREAVRLRLELMQGAGCDVVLVGRSAARGAEWPKVQTSVDELLKRCGVLPKT